MADSLEIGSLKAEVKPNGLVKLTITAMKDGNPVSFISPDDLRRVTAWVEAQIEDDVEDLL